MLTQFYQVLRICVGERNPLECGLYKNGQQFVKHNGCKKCYQRQQHGRSGGGVSGRKV